MISKRTKAILLSMSLLGLCAPRSFALPIGFGVNQGDHEYSELKSDQFYIYHDKRTPEEARMMLNSFEAARPVLEQWFDVKRDKVLPVITSAVSNNASFANVITDAIELQTRGQGDRDLAWHEYTHTTMYGRLDNFFGPAGTLIHLFFMPAWFLEGLAETTSMSVGMDRMAGIERYQALANDWPSYERLHSLYTSAFSTRGYATAGAFTAWVLRQGNPNDLPKLLDDFWDYTLPQWWPWSLIPFNDFLPMDAALQNYTGKTGEELWESYKEAAKEHWSREAKGPFYAGDLAAKKKNYTGFSGLRTEGKKVVMPLSIDDELWLVEIRFDALTDWATSHRKIKRLPDNWGASEEDLEGNITSTISAVSPKDPSEAIPLFTRPGYTSEVYSYRNGMVWVETDLSETRVCMKGKAKKSKVTCPYRKRLPDTLRLVDVKQEKNGWAKILWLSQRTQTMLGDRYNLVAFDLGSRKVVTLPIAKNGSPHNVGFSDKNLWILAKERSSRTVRKLDFLGNCQAVYRFKDHIEMMRVTADDQLVLGLYAGDDRYLKLVDPKTLEPEPCYIPEEHTSPLLYAMQQGGKNVDFKTALFATNHWKPTNNQQAQAELKQRSIAKPLTEATPEGVKTDAASTKAKWRGRPVLLFPWIGAEDALGSQMGIVTVPLMDHMQNESIRMTLMYGLESRYPHQEVSLTSDRFKADVQLTLFRHQTWNGLLRDRFTGEVKNTYYDERGGRLEVDRRFLLGSSVVGAGMGVKHSHLSPYIGIDRIPRGFRTEVSNNLSLGLRFWDFSWTNAVRSRFTREDWNENFDYDQLGVSTSLSYPMFWSSRFILGLEGSRTRGKKPMALQEVYRPLKTFIPGSGGGINQTSFAITPDDGLFTAVYGNTQARGKANWTMPLIKDFDSLWYVIYVERLDFTAFYNYGGAWYGDEPANGWDKLIRSHGYNLDLQFDNKGVRFNSGMGIGQVIGRDYQLYATFGFDALF